MSLTNSQYNSIQREYDAVQLKNRHTLDLRREEIYSRIPEYEQAVNDVSSLSLEFGKQIIDGVPGAAQKYHEALSALSQKKSNLLLSAGYPVDYLDPIYDCPFCQDTGYINGTRCRCFEQKIINFLYTQSNLQELLATENFSTLSYEYYEGEDLANFRKAVESSFSFIKNFDDEYKNLLFFGEVGTGKTFLSNCIAYEMIKQGHSVIYFTATKLFDLLSRYSFDTNQKEMLYKTYEDLYNCDLVIVDDLGTEFINSFTNTHLFSFLNERYLSKKSVIISTNLSLEELKTRYSDRVFSRLTNNFTFRKLSGSDIRVLKNI